jgi:CRISPR-associated endonuclease Cas3-HD
VRDVAEHEAIAQQRRRRVVRLSARLHEATVRQKGLDADRRDGANDAVDRADLAARAAYDERCALLASLAEEPDSAVLDAFPQEPAGKWSVLREDNELTADEGRPAARRRPPAAPRLPIALVAPYRDGASLESGGSATTEGDEGSQASRAISLRRHSRGVQDVAQRFATQAGVADERAADITLAALLHDAGKAHPAFQRWLRNGDELAALIGEPLAKSAHAWLGQGARARAGLPSGARHEVASLAIVKAHPRFGAAHDPLLVAWLVATHHGWGRPFFPGVDWPPRDDTFEADLDGNLLVSRPTVPLAELQAEWFTVRDALERKYGPWGLAHLEAIVRLADHRCSEREQVELEDEEPR